MLTRTVKSFRLSPIVPVKVIDIYHSPTEIKRFVTKMTFDFDTQPEAGAREYSPTKRHSPSSHLLCRT